MTVWLATKIILTLILAWAAWVVQASNDDSVRLVPTALLKMAFGVPALMLGFSAVRGILVLL